MMRLEKTIISVPKGAELDDVAALHYEGGIMSNLEKLHSINTGRVVSLSTEDTAALDQSIPVGKQIAYTLPICTCDACGTTTLASSDIAGEIINDDETTFHCPSCGADVASAVDVDKFIDISLAGDGDENNDSNDSEDPDITGAIDTEEDESSDDTDGDGDTEGDTDGDGDTTEDDDEPPVPEDDEDSEDSASDDSEEESDDSEGDGEDEGAEDCAEDDDLPIVMNDEADEDGLESNDTEDTEGDDSDTEETASAADSSDAAGQSDDAASAGDDQSSVQTFSKLSEGLAGKDLVLTSVSDSRLFVFANGEPIGYADRAKASKDTASIFGSDTFVEAFGNALEGRDQSGLDQFGWTPYEVSVNIDAAVANTLKAAEDRASMLVDEASATYCNKITRALKVASQASVKNVWDDFPNPIRDNLVAALEARGIEDAASLVLDVFSSAGESFSEALVSKAVDLASKSEDVLANTEDLVGKARFSVGRPSLADRLASGSVRVVSGADHHNQDEASLVEESQELNSVDRFRMALRARKR